MNVTRTKHGLFVAALCLFLLQLAWPAHAYVRAVTDLGVPVWWRSPCVAMNIYLGASPPTLTAEQYWNASRLAAQAWSHDDVACTGLSISMTKHMEDTAELGLDGKNVIVFVRDACTPSLAADAGAGERTCYPTNAMAVTTLFKRTTTGEIVDADMVINAVNFAWADLVADGDQVAGTTADFQNTLTHELGHVIGLAHPCYIANDGPAPLTDNTGKVELNCGDPGVLASVAASTMYPVVSTHDTERRSLTPDDQKAACDIYPSSQGACTYLGGSGCSVASQGPAHSSRVWFIGLACCFALGFAVFARWR
ncbi:MAG TPA: hypothetical protein VIM14_06965 [Polyangia bacterium]